MKKTATLFALLFSVLSFAQSVNDYKYVLVPSRFSFNKEPNAYGLNALTKSMLEKYGFVAYMDSDAMPDEVLNYNCNKLYVDVIENNNITNIRLTIVLKDCKNNILFKSEEGKSREKNWTAGYHEAFRNAAKSFDGLHYKYNGSTTQVGRELATATDKSTPVSKEVPIASALAGGMLFAQPILNGYQLVDTTPKVVMVIYSTGSKDVYLAERDAVKGILRNDNGQWVFEFYRENKLVSEKVNVKF